MRRTLTHLASGLMAIALIAAGSLLTVSSTTAAPIAGAPTTYCADPGTDPSMDTGAGTMIRCVTTVTNTITAIDPGTGVASGSAVIQVEECRGFAIGRLDPLALTCTTDTQTLVNLVTSIEQCNAVGYGGGNVLECSVVVVNDFQGVTPQAIGAATVNQCNGSATDTTGCNPFPATTTGATITQCNNSSYGGGQAQFICIASGTVSASLAVTVNQCNDANYGGGSWLNCSASLANTISALPAPTPTPTAVVGPTPTPTVPADSTPSPAPSGSPTAAPNGPTAAPTGAPVKPGPTPKSIGGQLPRTATPGPGDFPNGGLPPTSTFGHPIAGSSAPQDWRLPLILVFALLISAGALTSIRSKTRR